MSGIRLLDPPREVDRNLVFRRELIHATAIDPAFRRLVRQRCAEDALYYFNAFCWTYDPRRVETPLLPFVTYPFQDEAILRVADCILHGQDVAIAKSRDMGASWMNLTILEWMWHFRDQVSFLMVSRNERYVDESGNPDSLFWKIDLLHRHQPAWLLPRGRDLGDRDPNRRQGHLGNAENGSVIDGEATTGNIGRGGRRTAVLIDEFAAFDVKDGYATLAATRDTTRCRIFNSTPKGAGNAFHKVAREVPGVLKIDLHWSKHPLKNHGLYRQVAGKPVELLDDWKGDVEVFDKRTQELRTVHFPDGYDFIADGKLRSPWYDRECSRCATQAEIGQELDIDFLGSDYQFFDSASIEGLKKWSCRPPERVGDLEFDDALVPRRFADNVKGRWRLWIDLGADERPPMLGRYVMGADIAAGTGASNSAVAVYDCHTAEKVAEYANPNILPADFARLLVAAGRWFNEAKIIPDRSGPTGEVCVKKILAEGYGNVYYRRNEKKVGREVTLEPGVWLNPQAKTSCLEEYRDALGRHEIVNRSEAALDECLQFVRRPDGTIEHSASVTSIDPSGARTAHGDIVIADALASLGLADVRRCTLETGAPPEVPALSPAARMMEAKVGRFAPPVEDDSLGEGWSE